MKKLFSSLLIIGLILIGVSGCKSSKSFTFDVETGDKIKVELNTTDGYDLSSDIPFVISKDNKTLSQGMFIKPEYYNYYIDLVNEDSDSTIIDSGSNSNIDYVFYSYNNSEYNYIIKVKNSNTGILLGNDHSKQEAEKCFSLLTFSKDN